MVYFSPVIWLAMLCSKIADTSSMQSMFIYIALFLYSIYKKWTCYHFDCKNPQSVHDKQEWAHIRRPRVTSEKVWKTSMFARPLKDIWKPLCLWETKSGLVLTSPYQFTSPASWVQISQVKHTHICTEPISTSDSYFALTCLCGVSGVYLHKQLPWVSLASMQSTICRSWLMSVWHRKIRQTERKQRYFGQ